MFSLLLLLLLLGSPPFDCDLYCGDGAHPHPSINISACNILGGGGVDGVGRGGYIYITTRQTKQCLLILLTAGRRMGLWLARDPMSVCLAGPPVTRNPTSPGNGKTARNSSTTELQVSLIRFFIR